MTDAIERHVAVFGDACLNVILEIPERLQRGMNADIISRVRRPGGNALVTSMALASWGMPVTYAGVIGDDADGDEIFKWMIKTGVNTDAVVRRDPTRISYAIVDQDDRTILDERNERTEMRLEDWHKTRAMGQAVANASLVMVDKYSSAVHGMVIDELAKRRDKANRATLVYRTGSRPSQAAKIETKILGSADICFTKGAFLARLGLSKDAEEACRQMSEQFNVPVVVATLGQEGAAYYDMKARESSSLPAERLPSLKTTLGAGDFFRAGVIFAYLRDSSISESVRAGNKVAAKHCIRGESEDPPLVFFSFKEAAE